MGLTLVVLATSLVAQPPVEGQIVGSPRAFFFQIRLDNGRLHRFHQGISAWRFADCVVPGYSDRVRSGARVRVESLDYSIHVTVLDNFDDEMFGVALDTFLATTSGPRSLSHVDRTCLLGLAAPRYGTRQATHEKVIRDGRRAVVYRGLRSGDAEVRNRCEAILQVWTTGRGDGDGTRW
jgi:hypothetical protein